MSQQFQLFCHGMVFWGVSTSFSLVNSPPVSSLVVAQRVCLACPLNCAMHGFDTKLAFNLLYKSQTANRNGFRPASVSHRQLTLLNLMITAVQPLYGVGDHARANHVQVDVDQTVMQVFVGLTAVAW